MSYLSQSLHRDRDLFYDAQEIWEELCHRGFSQEEIESAYAHIERMLLRVPGPYWSGKIPVHRVYSPEEKAKLFPKARGYLWTLKSKGILDHALEDEIVHKAMNLEEVAGVSAIKTVAALTIFGYEHKIQEETERYSYSSSRMN